MASTISRWATACGILFLCAFAAKAGQTAPPGDLVAFPGPQPGVASASADAAGASLANSVLRFRWNITGKSFRPAEADDLIANNRLVFRPDASECFILQLPAGRSIAASQMQLTGGVTIENLPADPAAPRLAARYPGKGVSADLESVDHTLTVHWRAELRDGGNAIRQFITIAPAGEPIMIQGIILPSLGVPAGVSARTLGSAPGATVIAGNFFIAAEYPTAVNAISTDGQILSGTINRMTRMRAGDAVTAQRPLAFSSVVGVAAPGQLRRSFLHYLERERAHPYRPYLHYNSWCDISPNAAQGIERIDEFATELIQKRGVTMNGFVFDDGWDDPTRLWQLNSSNFPLGLTPLKIEAAKYGCHLGLWLSPWGGYGDRASERRGHARQDPRFAHVGKGFWLDDDAYFSLVEKTCGDFMRNDGVNFFKFDGIMAVEAGDGEAIRRLCDGLRSIDPDVYCLVSTGTWSSPFFLMYGDAVWRGGGDGGWVGKGSKRRQWLNFRDGQTYANIVSKNPLYPLNSLMLHGISCLGYGPWSELDPDQLRDEFRSYFSSGTALRELYITPKVLSQRNWDDLAEAARWARDNSDVLVDSHWIGGDPGRGQVYGWASWAPRKGILMLRNPTEQRQDFPLDIASALELPPGAPTRYVLTGPFADQAGQAPISINAGQTLAIPMEPFEVRVLEAIPRR
jgi:hypothetical protein